jgi:glutamine cyclotransferase
MSYRNFLRVIFVVIVFGGSYLAIYMKNFSKAPRYNCKVINTFPHDADAFTQGLILDPDGQHLFESTGRYGFSKIRKVELTTGKIVNEKALPAELFGEGLARLNDRLYQLTWKEGKILIYDLELNLLETKSVDINPMWGLTTDGKYLILSDGTSRLRFLDPETLEPVTEKDLFVRDGRRSISLLNELEFAQEKIYANIWQSDEVYEINPKTGEVTAIIDLKGLWPKKDRPADGLMNGLAFDRTRGKGGRMIVTGKLCPALYEVEFVPVTN